MCKTKVIEFKNSQSHSVAVSVVFMGGANASGEPDSGLAHLVEHLLFRASGNLTQKELYKNLELNGITLNATTDDSYISLYFKCLPEKLLKALEIVAGMVTAKWNNEMLIAEKKVVKAEIVNSSRYANRMKSTYLNARATKNIIGTKSSIDKLSYKKVLAARKRLLGNTKYFIISGNYKENEFAPFLETLNSLDSENLSIDYEKPLYKTLQIISSNYNYISLSFIFDKKDIEISKLKLLKSMMFDGLGSVASGILREDKGYTYNVDSEIYFSGNRGMLNIYYEVENFDDVIFSFRDLSSIIENFESYLSIEQFEQTIPFFTQTLDYLYDDNSALVEKSEICLIDESKVFDIEKTKMKYQKISLPDILATGKNIFKESERCLEIGCDNVRKLKKISEEFNKFLKI